nr:copia protein [Tanacetum cinerariifolium]
MQKYLLKQQFEGYYVSVSEGLHKGFDRFQTLLSQLEIHGAGVLHEDANQKFLRSLPSSWFQVALIMRIKPRLDGLSFDDLYNNLRVFERNVKGATASSSNIQNVAFVSANNISTTNDVSTAYSVSSPSVLKSQKEGSSSYTDEVAMISMRIKKFHKRTGRKLQFDTKDPVGFDKTKMECFNCHKMRHFARDCRAKGNQDNRRRDVGYNGNKARDNDAQNYAMMAYSSSNLGFDNKLNTQMSANDKFGLGYGDYRYGSILSYENEVLHSVFMNKESDLENTSVNDRYDVGLHAVPSPMTGNYMPFGPNVEIDYSKFTYGLKQTLVDESDSKPSEYASCESDSSVEITTSMPELVKSIAKVVCEPKVALKDKGIIDNGCHRHMTGNKAHLADYQEFKGGSVAFGGSSGRITGKGKIKANRLDFEDVYYVEELKHYNLFSVLQICDKKNRVLFTDIDCLVLSPNFKLPNENQVLLKIPRQHNMYSFNLKNIDPSRDLACLFTEASIDESNKWHRRLGHVNFKNLNKLVKGNLVRGLPSNIFKNDHTRVVFQKGQQHKTSCKAKTREYSNARTPQQNGVAERKNKTLIEAARTMLADSFLPTTFWAEAVNNACYVLNRVLVTKPQNKTPYELLAGKQPIISYLRPFGCHVTILNTIDQLGKFDGKSDLGFLVGYSLNSKAVRVYNLETKRVEENLKEATPDIQNANTSSTNVLNTVSSPLSTVGPSRALNDGEPSYPDDPSMPHLKDIYASPSEGIFIDSSYDDKGVVYRNKKDERGVVVRNKAQLVAQGHSQEEGIDYDEVFSPVARIEAIRIFLAFASYMGFIVYQMDVKSAFLYGTVNEKVYATQPPGFVDPKFPNKKSWCDEFEELMKNRFQMSSMGELTFFLGLKTASTPIETQKPLVKDGEAANVDVQLYRSMIGSLMYLTAFRPDIMFAICVCSRFQTIVATSTTEGKYFAVAHYCGQVLWIQNQLLDYGFNIMNT